jgi:hypothetical protein
MFFSLYQKCLQKLKNRQGKLAGACTFRKISIKLSLDMILFQWLTHSGQDNFSQVSDYSVSEAVAAGSWLKSFKIVWLNLWYRWVYPSATVVSNTGLGAHLANINVYCYFWVKVIKFTIIFPKQFEVAALEATARILKFPSVLRD